MTFKDGMYSRYVPPEEQALVERLVADGALVPTPDPMPPLCLCPKRIENDQVVVDVPSPDCPAHAVEAPA